MPSRATRLARATSGRVAPARPTARRRSDAERTREAAISMASGIPSSAASRRSTAGMSSDSTLNEGSTDRARSTNNRNEANAAKSSTRRALVGTASGSSGTIVSDSSQRLPAGGQHTYPRRSPQQRRGRQAAAPATTCSQLSNTTRSCRSASDPRLHRSRRAPPPRLQRDPGAERGRPSTRRRGTRLDVSGRARPQGASCRSPLSQRS